MCAATFARTLWCWHELVEGLAQSALRLEPPCALLSPALDQCAFARGCLARAVCMPTLARPPQGTLAGRRQPLPA